MTNVLAINLPKRYQKLQAREETSPSPFPKISVTWKGRAICFIQVFCPMTASIGTLFAAACFAKDPRTEALLYVGSGAEFWFGIAKWPILEDVVHIIVFYNPEGLLVPTQVYENITSEEREIPLHIIQWIFGAHLTVLFFDFIRSTQSNDPINGVDFPKKSGQAYIEMIGLNTLKSQAIAHSCLLCTSIGLLYGGRYVPEPFNVFLEMLGRAFGGFSGAGLTYLSLFYKTMTLKARAIEGVSSPNHMPFPVKAGWIAMKVCWFFAHFGSWIIGVDANWAVYACGACMGLQKTMDVICYTHTPKATFSSDPRRSRKAASSWRQTCKRVYHIALGLGTAGFITWQSVEGSPRDRITLLGALSSSFGLTFFAATRVTSPQETSVEARTNATAFFVLIFSLSSFVPYNIALKSVKVSSSAIGSQPVKEFALTLFAYGWLGGMLATYIHWRCHPKKAQVHPSYTPLNYAFFCQIFLVVLRTILYPEEF